MTEKRKKAGNKGDRKQHAAQFKKTHNKLLKEFWANIYDKV
jgi:hypothetical protein